MTGSEPDLPTRLYGMMQHLMVMSAQRLPPDHPEARGVVTRQDALDAVLQLAAAIDEPFQAGRIPADYAKWLASLLMVIRDYIQPLPFGLSEEVDGNIFDFATEDLEQMVLSLRTGANSTGISG